MTRRVSTPEQLRDLMGESWAFSAEQWAAVSAPLAPTVVIAGAGSGKTTVMAGRVVWLVANGLVTPDRVLGLTFTTKATGELQQRVRAALRRADLLGDDVEEPTVSTYHSYAAGLLSEQGLRIGHEPDARLIADASRYQLAARAIAAYEGPVEHLSDHPATVVGNLLALDGELSEHLVTPETLRAHDIAFRAELLAAREESRAKAVFDTAVHAIDRRLELIGLVAAYRLLKADLGLIDFSDQIALTARLVEEHPEVGAGERERFGVVLLDEYQDTSVAQARLLRALFGGAHPVMAVGDPNQAIYGWRGASVSNILGFHADFPPAPGEPERRLSLATNRRSDRRILEVANHLAAPLYRDGTVAPLQVAPDAGDGGVRLAVHDTYGEELTWLAGQVRAAHDAGTPWKEIGVLVRNNRHGASIYDALTEAEIPVEIVGVGGLLRLPEVAEVLATLSLLDDVTANADLLTLLSSARWAIGPRDLALLGRRAREVAGVSGEVAGDVHAQLQAAVAEADPTEVVALSDALESPGDLPYSAEARERFALLAGELRRLRRHAAEPVLDLVRRIIDTTGVDVELAAAVSESARARRDNLGLFEQAVAEFRSYDGRVTLDALLAWLRAEDEFEQGLDAAVPSEADSVKLLTVHRAKGLEWDVVLLPGMTTDQFPVTRGRSHHLSSPQVLPVSLRGDARDQEDLRELTAAGFKEWDERRKAHAATEELRLAYVAWTRARHLLVVSAWRWRATLKKGLGPSTYAVSTREAMAVWGAEPERWLDAVDRETETSPYAEESVDLPWPIDHRTTEAARRREAATLMATATEPEGWPGPLEQALVETWDVEIDRLLAELADEGAEEVVVPRPSALSATSLSRLRDDPGGLARDLARPMPRRPTPAARFGTRFHAWVEQRFGQESLFDPEELPGRADVGIESDEELRALIVSFEEGPFGSRAPHRVEASFSIVLAGQVVRGRVDAVYTEGPGRYLLVDWKTNQHVAADPLQLAIYRVAWAELSRVPVESVRAVFHYVRSGETVEPADLPGREGLERLLRR
jgi:DNA helicase II / ATP-dependent DNA helicase PcrA